MAARVADFQSGDVERTRRALARSEALDRRLLPYVLPLLGWDEVVPEALGALRRAAPRITGQLIDALLDPEESVVIRRRIPRVLKVADSQRAADGLLLGLGDRRFEVRYQCAIALVQMTERNPDLRLPADAVLAAARREVEVGKKVWESRRLLERPDDEKESPFFEAFLRDRTSRSLEHVFNILSLALEREPLRLAYRALSTVDETLRGTALEYLENVLPEAIRLVLWPFLAGGREPARAAAARTREQILEDLMRSGDSISINLESLRRKWETGKT
jgi:hypothetical protein